MTEFALTCRRHSGRSPSRAERRDRPGLGGHRLAFAGCLRTGDSGVSAGQPAHAVGSRSQHHRGRRRAGCDGDRHRWRDRCADNGNHHQAARSKGGDVDVDQHCWCVEFLWPLGVRSHHVAAGARASWNKPWRLLVDGCRHGHAAGADAADAACHVMILTGVSVATVCAAPVGAFVGEVWGWRAAFIIAATLPRYTGRSGAHAAEASADRLPGPAHIAGRHEAARGSASGCWPSC